MSFTSREKIDLNVDILKPETVRVSLNGELQIICMVSSTGICIKSETMSKLAEIINKNLYNFV